MKKLLIGLFLLSLLFTRFFNLPKTTRFTRDESSNLVDIHRIYVDHDITLIGPIDATSTIIYPSLTFYMLLPFAILGQFTPASPSYGTAFFGVLAALLLVLLIQNTHKKFVWWIGLLTVFWYPLIESSRWAWNPHLVPFTSSIALLFWFRKEKIAKLFAGIFFGLSFHLHYLVIVPFALFGLCSFLLSLKSKKQISNLVIVAIGFGLMIIPFVIFDIKNPPGLFFGRFLQHNMVSNNFSNELSLFPSTFVENLWKTLLYVSRYSQFAIILGVIFLTLFVRDVITRRESLQFIIPVIFQIAAISFLLNFGGRYFLLASPFFLLWLVSKRKNWEENLAKLAIFIMIVGGVLSLPKQLTQPPLPPGGYVVGEAVNLIKQSVVKNDRKNVNVAVLSSPDSDPFGVIYRHTLLVHDVKLRSEAEYDLSDNLFVISTSPKEKLFEDRANILNPFREGRVTEEYEIKGTDWKLYLLNK